MNGNKNETGKNGRAFLFTAIALACFIVIFDILWIILPKRDFSESENRMLASAPEITGDSLSEGGFGKGFESFIADRVPLRDTLVSLRTAEKRLLGANDNGGVYFGTDGYLFLKPAEQNKESLARNLNAMDLFAWDHNSASHYAAIIPNSCYVLSQKLPEYAEVPDQKAQLAEIAENLNDVKFIDVTGTLLAHKDEYIYYRTDHHWTTLGAYYTFCKVAESMGLDISEVSYSSYDVSASFEGTLASKSGAHGVYDVISVCMPEGVMCRVDYVDAGKEPSGTVYDKSALETKDKYALFLGGNYPLVKITTSAESGRRLLLFKDSYANCFVQFLLPHFEEIIIVDPRYYYEDSSPLISRYGITDVLYLYNLDTFNTDNSLADALH
ncbi:MAG: hypothetical protein J5925_05995 [Clostridia bacterium]|nr:hypothetical protein [Clostridia bacterium]